MKELRCQEAPEAPSATKPTPVHTLPGAWQPDDDKECIFHETQAERADLVDWTIRLDHEGNLPQISHFSAAGSLEGSGMFVLVILQRGRQDLSDFKYEQQSHFILVVSHPPCQGSSATCQGTILA